MNLLQLHKNEEAAIIGFAGGRGFQQRLMQMGFHIGDRVKISERGAFGGPVMVQIHSSEFALGRGIAAKILIKKVL